MNKKNNSVVMIIIGILAFVLLASGVFYGTYYFIINKSSNSYEKEVKAVIDKINEVNSSVSSLLNGQAIDSVKARTELSPKIDVLSKQKELLDNMTATDKYKKDHENLINGISNNMLIFRQIDAIIKNPNGKDLEKAGEDLIKYKDKAVQNYSLVNIKNFKVGLTDSGNKLVEYTSIYVNELVKLNRDNEITQSKNQDYINSLDALLAKFTPINIDYSAEMSKVRDAKGNTDNIVALAEKNRDDLSSIKQEFASLTVPSKAVGSYKIFSNILESFDNYLQSFVYSANNEKLAGNALSSDKLKELYAEPVSKFSSITKNYNDFIKAYNEFRQSSNK
ncbi:hypothetical protein NBE98_13915 [Clostridium swellfunianum]|uniref:hypothetical protein n=1 Tax=Clostridium swellfunianum TaxID=1367462 RepID=UPI00202FFE32|nr:hypothetical protein [Clostridium swellfunianum]MCM0649458.1 hypothetical protein [Clostridium swellfunianum]